MSELRDKLRAQLCEAESAVGRFVRALPPGNDIPEEHWPEWHRLNTEAAALRRQIVEETRRLHLTS